MRHSTRRLLSRIATTVAILFFVLTISFFVFSFIAQGNNYFGYASLVFSLFSFAIGKIAQDKKVLPTTHLPVDEHYVDRVCETTQLTELLNIIHRNKESGNARLLFVSGVAGVGKTQFLRKSINSINENKLKGIDFPATAYYVEFDKHRNLLANCYMQLGIPNCHNVMYFAQELWKSSPKRNTILVIDNIDIELYRNVKDFVLALHLNFNPKACLLIIIGITKSSNEEASLSKAYEIVPSFFRENELYLIEKSFCNSPLDNSIRTDIINKSNGLPAYMRFLYSYYRESHSEILSNQEDINFYIRKQLSCLTEVEKKLLAILAYHNLICEKGVQYEVICGIIGYDIDDSKKKLVRLALIYERASIIYIESFIARECQNELIALRAECFLLMYRFYTPVNRYKHLAVASMLLSHIDTYDEHVLMQNMYDVFSENRYYFWVNLGACDRKFLLNPNIYNNIRVFNNFRYCYLESLLQLGRYPEADSAINWYENSSINLPSISKDILPQDFNLIFVIADLKHLSNLFYDAIEIASMLEICTLDDQAYNRCLYLKAHCLKHIGDDLLLVVTILNSLLEKESLSPMLRIQCLYSLASVHLFWDNMSFDYDSSFQEISRIAALSDTTLSVVKNAKRHEAIYYLKRWDEKETAIKIITNTLNELEITQQRIKYNFYFELAELLRITHSHETVTIESILKFYLEARAFAQEVNDYNLLSCSILGEILLKFSVDGKQEQEIHDANLCINEIKQRTEEIGLRINHSYAVFVYHYVNKQEIPMELINHWEKMQFVDVARAARRYNAQQDCCLKLTVM